MNSFSIATLDKYQLVDIGLKVRKAVLESRVENGFVLIFVPHTTAAILITEDEWRLLQDWLNFFKKIVSGFHFQHSELDGNGDAHIISGLLNAGKTLPIQNGKIVLGKYQHIFLVELDGPQKREVTVQVCQSTFQTK